MAQQPDPLSHLHIYHTKDDTYSRLPALRLLRFVHKTYPHIHTSLHCGGSSPSDITTFAHELITSSNPTMNWVINATGGTKLMTAGLLDCVGLPRVQVVYREREGLWHVLARPQQNQAISLVPIDIPVSVTDTLPALALFDAQFSAPDGSTWTATNVLPLPIVHLTQRAIAQRWVLSRAWDDLNLPLRADQGLLFEHYVAALLLAAGVTSLCCNARLRHKDGDVLEEVDIVANSRGRLLLVECKWGSTNSEPIISQLERAAQRRRAFGGLNARFVFVRPVKKFSLNQTRLASLIGVTLVSHSNITSLVDVLCESVGVPLTPELADVKKLLTHASIPTPAEWALIRPRQFRQKAHRK